MMALIPSSAAPGSTTAGTLGAPMRSSRRTGAGGAVGTWANEVTGARATTIVARIVTRRARTAAARRDAGEGIGNFIRGTHYSRHSFRRQTRGPAGYRTC